MFLLVTSSTYWYKVFIKRLNFYRNAFALFLINDRNRLKANNYSICPADALIFVRWCWTRSLRSAVGSCAAILEKASHLRGQSSSKRWTLSLGGPSSLKRTNTHGQMETFPYHLEPQQSVRNLSITVSLTKRRLLKYGLVVSIPFGWISLKKVRSPMPDRVDASEA